jgi:hypothetical protein
LVSCVRSELNPEFASRCKRVYRVSVHFGFEAEPLEVRRQIGKGRRDYDDFSIESVDRLEVTIDCQTADQTIRVRTIRKLG